nr:reverse transcriptase domain-containing protein [Tanacetum cinerariifolium]
MIQNKVPPKLRDPGSFLIPCNFNKTFSCNALADLGASINQEIFAEFDEFMAMTADKNSDSEYDTEEPPFKKITINTNYKIKTSLEEPPMNLKLKPLPNNLEYVFLEEPSFLPVIISSQLSKEKKNLLISVLKKHKQTLAWKTTDILCICPSFYKHKIQLLDDKKPFVQKQRTLNPNMQEVVKLLDSDIIYPIADSPWVSPIHCVPKKSGIIVVTNENDELVPTRTVTGWRVCIDYRKLNEAAAKDHFPLPFMNQMLERLTGNKYFYFLDGFSGYFQIPIDPNYQEKKTFSCPFRSYAYRKGTENVKADHLSHIENDKISDDSEVDDNFPGETLMEINTKDESWFADFANFLVGDVIPKRMRALKIILEKTVKDNPAISSRKLDDALWAFRTTYKTPTAAMNVAQLKTAVFIRQWCEVWEGRRNVLCQLQEILEFLYLLFKIVLFRVKWFDTSNEGHKVKHFVLRNMTQIWAKGESFKHDQYILATQVKQVFYLEDMARRPPKWKVVEHVNHKKFSNGGVIVVTNDPDVIHFNNSSDLAVFTSLNDLDFATLRIDDGQSTDVDTPLDIIDVDEDDDIIDDKDAFPHDLIDSDDEDLVNDDDDDMSADVARGHGGDSSGDDCPPSHQGTQKPNLDGRKEGGLHTRQEIRNLGSKKITNLHGLIPLRFEWNDRETLMPLGDHATHWANYLGELIRELPIHYPSWRQVPTKRKTEVLAKIEAQHWVQNPKTGTYDVERIRRGHPVNISVADWDAQIAFGMIPRTLPGVLKITKTEQRARSYAGRDAGYLLPFEIRW